MSNPFEKLSSDEIRSIALAMDLPEIIGFCREYRRFDSIVCQDTPTSRFWISRLIQDFGIYWVDVRNKRDTTPKQFYDMISVLKENPSYMYIRDADERAQPGYISTMYGIYALRYIAINGFQATRDPRYLTLIDYIIDHWHTPINPNQPVNVNINTRPVFYDDINMTVNNGIMLSLTDAGDRGLVKYMLRSMNDENIVSKPHGGLFVSFPVIYNFATDTEILDLIFNKLDRDGVELWIEQLTFSMDSLTQEQRENLVDLVRRYERIHDLHVIDNM
jgi:hypothetical protein